MYLLNRSRPTSLTCLVAMTFALAFCALPVLGSGAEEKPMVSPEATATAAYNDGIRMREKATALDEKIAAEAEESRRAKLEKEQRSLFEKAAGNYQQAIDAKADFPEAHGSLGYALRRLGRYEEAMESYDTSLELNPNYPEAMEYRGEALLGLDRVEEAQQAYERLVMVSPDHAMQLLEAMKGWAADESHAALVDEMKLGDWLEHHRQLSSSVSSAAHGGSQSWR